MSKDYTQGKIYQIKVNTDEEYLPYIGSTCKNYLSQRMSYHHQDYKKYKNKPEKYSYISSFILFDKFGFENCFIELLELVSCNCNDELKKKEREWIKKINCCNKVKRPICSKEEKIVNDKICKKTYEEKSKGKNSERRKIKCNCDCGSIIRRSDKSIHEKSLKHLKHINNSNLIKTT